MFLYFKIITYRHLCEFQGHWKSNAVVANQYVNASQCVGYHADQLGAIGPRPTIASLSLGVARSFRLKRSVALGDDHFHRGTISIRLPHNSLLIMHPPCQELYQHSIPPVSVLSSHPISLSSQINLTFHMFHPEWTESFTHPCS